jgi:hypothetical protein
MADCTVMQHVAKNKHTFSQMMTKAGPLTRTELFENDAKNTFMFPMTSPEKLNEVK